MIFLIYIEYITKMIVFEDSDLYAFISYLKIKSYLLLKVHRIMVQESIKKKFQWLLTQSFNYFPIVDSIIVVFHSMEELLDISKDFQDLSEFPNLSLMSIWLEDIVAAKILAMKLNKNVTFINANFEFCNGIVFPLRKKSNFDLLQSNISNAFETLGDKINLDTCTSSVYNLFYDGKWQIPVKGTYWIYDNNICAQTTWEDLNRCKKSAEKASKNWRILPMSSRIEILNNLSTALHCNGKFQLAMEIKEWLQYLKTFENTLSCYQDEKFEISNIHTAKGIVTLINKDESTLFCHLTFALTLGNCVIIKLRVF
ncbi:uncharacterized protein LOC114254698 isoform X1 [Monomorium pharaonis]|uniref:uncharacterized protein LOC114254698 isoform X1 n=1 Tax=Monomorium pharaonis TaxID=307658 RepID=UPI0017477690|nr:uncharacterized protein LOC114254698 isoform X1 [Monomorium pharaonis]